MNRKRGFTLVELLCVLGAIAILCTISIPVIKTADDRSKERADKAMIFVFTQAFEDYRFNDYGSLNLADTKKVTLEANGKVKINAYLNMNSDDIAALSGSGKGEYPQTKDACLAVIKLYTGTLEKIDYPAKGVMYDYFYNKQTGEVSVLRLSDIPAGQRTKYIALSGG